MNPESNSPAPSAPTAANEPHANSASSANTANSASSSNSAATKNTLPLKDRMKILRSPMPELDPTVRSRNFQEVNLGLPAAAALPPFLEPPRPPAPGCARPPARTAA